jgi:integrase
MSEANSTPATPRSKPAKPYPDYPLYAHAAGVWAKKIKGKVHYFGKWDDPDGALNKYLAEKDALHAGRKPRPEPGALTVKGLCNLFLNAKAAARDVGEITLRTWQDYHGAAELLIEHLGKQRSVTDLGPDDFEQLRAKLAKKWGPMRLGNTIQRIRCIMKYAEDNLLDHRIRYGQGFKRPSRKVLRIDRAKKGPKLFTREEILELLGAAPDHFRAMLLLGINAAYGNADIGSMPLRVVNLETGWIHYPRPKTGIDRRCLLWPETVAALREAITNRPEPKDPTHAELVFITKYGKPWGKDDRDNPISKETKKLMNTLGIGGRKGLGFYTLRHVFRTVADETKDQPAVDLVMGHEIPHMSTVYREKISDERLKAVADHVHAWLFAEPKQPAPEIPAGKPEEAE